MTSICQNAVHMTHIANVLLNLYVPQYCVGENKLQLNALNSEEHSMHAENRLVCVVNGYLVFIVYCFVVSQGLLTRQKTGRSCTKLGDSLLKKLLLYWRLMKSKSLTGFMHPCPQAPPSFPVLCDCTYV